MAAAAFPQHYGGGQFAWPVPGGTISQYFHYGHPALDIQAPYGTRVLAAASGTVIFAGWKNNGGGYQVWIAHGSGLYTTYNHMSAITVGVGASTSGAAQQVGRVGQSGWATGPHLHFEVWRGRGLGQRLPGQPADLSLAGSRRRRHPAHRRGRASGAGLCDDPDDVPRPAEDPRARR